MFCNFIFEEKKKPKLPVQGLFWFWNRQTLDWNRVSVLGIFGVHFWRQVFLLMIILLKIEVLRSSKTLIIVPGWMKDLIRKWCFGSVICHGVANGEDTYGWIWQRYLSWCCKRWRHMWLDSWHPQDPKKIIYNSNLPIYSKVSAINAGSSDWKWPCELQSVVLLLLIG